MEGWGNQVPSHLDTVQGAVVFGSLDLRPAVELPAGASTSITQAASGPGVKRIGLNGTLFYRGQLTIGVDQSWTIEISANGQTYDFVDKSALYARQQVLSLADIFIDVPLETLSSFSVTMKLEGPAGPPTYYILPCAVLTGVVVDDTITGQVVENRFPYPNQLHIPSDLPTWVFDYVNYDADALPDDDIEITLNDVVIYTGMAAVFGAVADVAETTRRRRVTITPSGAGPWDTPTPSGQHFIQVTGPGGLDESWSWFESNIDAPVIIRAQPLGGRLVEIEFSEDMSDGEDVDNPGGYDVYPTVLPGFPPEVVGVEVLNTRTVRLELDDELTFRNPYKLTVSNVMTDASGQIFDVTNNSYIMPPLEYIAADRELDFFEQFPRYNKCNDPEDELLHLSRVIEDIFGQLFHRADSFVSALDPRTAPLDVVCDMLSDLGNDTMFAFEMTEAEKRSLVLLISGFQEQVGTEEGMEAAIRFFLNIDVEIVTRADDPFWVLGESILGETTVIAPPPDSERWLTIWVKLPVGDLIADLTDEELARIEIIIRVMSPENAKYGGVVEC